MHHAFHVNLALLRGDPGDVLPDTMAVLRSAPPFPLVRVSVPLVLALQGDLAGGRAEFAALRDVPEGMPPRWLGTVGQIAFAAIALGDRDVARNCHRLLLPTAPWCGGDGGGSPFATGSCEHHLGQLALTTGDRSTAAGHFARGVAVDDRIGARPYAALGRLGLARSLAGDEPDRARRVAHDAADELRGLDMPGPLATALALAAPPDTGAGTPAARPGGLTERE